MPLSAEHGRLALATAKSNNAKIGDCATTYAAQASCPTSCVFFNGGGCYAENGRLYAALTRPLNGAAELADASPVDVACEEAAAIDALPVIPGRPMRLHTVGDCATDETARIVSAAAERYMDRGGGQVWTYTHAWRDVERVSWGRVSVLASCEDVGEFDEARERGYAPSIVVQEFASRKLYAIDELDGSPGPRRLGSEAVLPCPAQTSSATCSSCRLCFDDTKLLARGYAIAFAVHGTASVVRAARKALADPADPDRRKTSRDFALAYLNEHGHLPRPVELERLAGVTSASAQEMLARLRAEQELAA